MTIASQRDFDGMQRVGRLVAETLVYLTAEAAPGMTTAESRRARGPVSPNPRHCENTIVVRRGRPVVLTSLGK